MEASTASGPKHVVPYLPGFGGKHVLDAARWIPFGVLETRRRRRGCPYRSHHMAQLRRGCPRKKRVCCRECIFHVT